MAAINASRVVSFKERKVHQHLEKWFRHEGKSMFWPFILNQTMNTDFLIQLQWYTVLTDWTWILFHLRKMLYQGPEGSSTPEKPFCHEGKSMFWSFILNQTMNTDFLIQLQWYKMLTD